MTLRTRDIPQIDGFTNPHDLSRPGLAAEVTALCEISALSGVLAGTRAVRLLVQHTAAGMRSRVSSRIETHQRELESALLEAFESEFPKWTRSLATMLSAFDEWVASALCEKLTVLSIQERDSFLAPLLLVRKQAFRVLQQFRERLSDSAMRAFGVPLRTTETEIDVVEPGAHDVRVGRVFDRNRELLSPILPVWLAGNCVNEREAQLCADLERLERKSPAAEAWS